MSVVCGLLIDVRVCCSVVGVHGLLMYVLALGVVVFDSCCWLFAGRWLLLVVCCLWLVFVVRCVLIDVCCLLFVVRCVLPVGCCLIVVVFVLFVGWVFAV